MATTKDIATKELSPDIVGKLEYFAKQMDKAKDKTVANLREMGRILVEANALFADHNGGTFGKWVQERCGISRQTAHNYMGIYEAFDGDRCQSLLQRSSVDALYLLARDTTSEDVLEKARKLANKGERITAKVVKQLKADLEPEPDDDEPAQQAQAYEPAEDGSGSDEQSPVVFSSYASISEAVQDLKDKVASCYLRWPAGCIDSLVGNLEALAEQYEKREAAA